MLHFLASAYFVLLTVAAATVIAAMLTMNRGLILKALGFDDLSTIHPLPTRTQRRTPARVVRMGSPGVALQLAA